MDSLNLVARNGDAVRQALELGEILHIETASEEITDEFLLFAISSGLLAKWATAFPDPRHKPEIGLHVLLASSLAARFARLYSIRNSGFVLRSARVLGALGYSVEVRQPGNGLSRRGTADDAVHSGDVLRKLLVKMETEVVISDQDLLTRGQMNAAGAPPPQIKVRQRLSRRAVKQKIDEAQAERRGQAVAAQMLGWYNQLVGLSLLEYAQLGAGRRLHILDATRIEVELLDGEL